MLTTLVPAPRLTVLESRILQHEAIPALEADFVAGTLVDADLRGIHSHGSLRLGRYVRELRSGITNPGPQFRTTGEGPAYARVDGDGGLGQLVGRYAMELCLAKAESAGSAIVTACRSRHFGAAGTFAMMALARDFIGMAMTVASPRLAPTGGAEPLFGNNPLAVAIPGDHGFPLLIDFAMGSIAAGRLELAAANDEPIPPGVARGLDGSPTTDARVALKGTIAPIGEYKGYGMTLLIEVLAGLLGGAPYFAVARDQADGHMRRQGIGHFFMAIDPSRYMPVPQFKEAVRQMVERTKASRRLQGVDEIFLPGEIEAQRRQERLEHGIPLADSTVAMLQGLARDCGAEF